MLAASACYVYVFMMVYCTSDFLVNFIVRLVWLVLIDSFVPVKLSLKVALTICLLFLELSTYSSFYSQSQLFSLLK